MDGFFYINKKVNMTTYDIIRVLKKKFKITKIGHTGTLDPLASGLVIICVGKATKLAEEITSDNKTYEAEVIFGSNYDTYDIKGLITATKKPPLTIDFAVLKNNFQKSYLQEPPMYSAIKQAGKKLYELARANKTVEREKRLVHIYTLDFIDKYENNIIKFITNVSKGTYIRSLAYDMGLFLNTYGALYSLKRLKIGNISIDEAKDLDNILDIDLIKLEDYLKLFPKLILDDYLIHLVKNGVYLDERQIKIDSNFVVYNKNDEMIAYYKKIANYKYKPILIL